MEVSTLENAPSRYAFKCADRSQFKYWNSSEGEYRPEQGWLGDEEASLELLGNCQYKPGFTLITTFGDPMYPKENSIRLSQEALLSILGKMSILQFYSSMYATETYNISHHVQYEDDQPTALTLLLRIPGNSRSINIALSIQLHNLHCICLLAATDQPVAEQLHQRCIDDAALLAKNPLYILAFVLEERFLAYKMWELSLYREINEVETSTRMVFLSWQTHTPPSKADWLRKYDEQLTKLHATNAELQHCRTVLSFGKKFGDFCLSSAEKVEELRSQLGLKPILKHHRLEYEQHVMFFLGRLENVKDKSEEMIERWKTQVNVVFSLVAQRDSSISNAMTEDSNRVAIVASRGSATMKTITTITLLLLPAPLMASIWVAGIIQIGGDDSWKAFIGVAMGLATVVFGVWWVC